MSRRFANMTMDVLGVGILFCRLADGVKFTSPMMKGTIVYRYELYLFFNIVSV